MAGLVHLLQGICELAVEAVPGCESASITVIEGNNARTPAASDQRARRLDEAQYRDGDGPGLRAARLDADILIQLDALELAADIQATEDGTGVRSGPTWREQARDAGISAVVSMPIAGPADLRAALNLYTGRAGGWNPEAMALADALVTYAGDAVTIGRRLDPGHLFQP
jgi:hypothetical protein